MSNLCRCCHSIGSFKSFNSEANEGLDENNCDYSNILRTCFDIELNPVSEKDKSPMYSICDVCIGRLLDAHSFKQQVLSCEKHFQNLLPLALKALAAETEVKEELPEEKLPDTDCDAALNDDYSDDQPFPDEEHPKHELKRKKVKKKEIDKKPPSIKPKPKEHPKHELKRKKVKKKEIDKKPPSIKPKGTTHRKLGPPYHLQPSEYERIGDSLKCTRCERLFLSISGLRFHVKTVHLKITYICSVCSEGFRTPATFNKHKLEEHSIDDRIKCNACDSTFNTQILLNNHKNSYHMLGVKHKCPHCDYESFSLSNMQKHKITHKSVKEHHCKFCKKAFLRKTTLVFHERIHTGDRRKVCSECGQAFVQKASLNYHMTKYHPEVKF